MTGKPTFSQSIAGYGVGFISNRSAPAPVNNVLIGDTSIDGIALVNPGGQALANQTGSPVLCKGPDGAFHWYRLRPVGADGGGTIANPTLEFIGP